jgi:hypothetical protein
MGTRERLRRERTALRAVRKRITREAAVMKLTTPTLTRRAFLATTAVAATVAATGLIARAASPGRSTTFARKAC